MKAPSVPEKCYDPEMTYLWMLHIPEIGEAVNQEQSRVSIWIVALRELVHLKAGLVVGRRIKHHLRPTKWYVRPVESFSVLWLKLSGT